MRWIVGGVAVVLGCASVFAADEATPEAHDYNAQRAALVATVVPPGKAAAQGWESLESAIQAVTASRQRIIESLRLRYELKDDVPIRIDPLVLLDAPMEDPDLAPARPEGEAPAPDADGDGAKGDGEAAPPPDMDAIALRGARTLMRSYDGNHFYDRLTTLRVQPQVFMALDDKPLIARDFSYAEGVRTLARLEAVRMWRFLDESEDKKAADSFENILALGVVLSREPTIMGRLQSIAVIGVATQTLERWMLDHRLEGGLARDLLARLDRQAARLAPMTYTLAGERLTGLDTIGRVFTREIPAPMVMADGEGGSLKSQAENEKDLNELYDAMDAWVKVAAHERRGIDPSPAGLAASMPEGLVLVKVVAPGLEQAVWWSEAGRVDIDGLRLMLALEASRAEAGKYPESLDALVPAVLKALPVDGFAPDGKYRYRLVEGAVMRAGTAYVLYSVGYDGEDNGGKASEGEQLSVLSPSKKGEGLDYVVNRRAPG